jgi:hypothetical protein
MPKIKIEIEIDYAALYCLQDQGSNKDISGVVGDVLNRYSENEIMEMPCCKHINCGETATNHTCEEHSHVLRSICEKPVTQHLCSEHNGLEKLKEAEEKIKRLELQIARRDYIGEWL